MRVGIKRRVAGGRYTFVIFKKVGKCVCIFKTKRMRDFGDGLTRGAKHRFGAFHGLIGNERADTLPVGFAEQARKIVGMVSETGGNVGDGRTAAKIGGNKFCSLARNGVFVIIPIGKLGNFVEYQPRQIFGRALRIKRRVDIMQKNAKQRKKRRRIGVGKDKMLLIKDGIASKMQPKK